MDGGGFWHLPILSAFNPQHHHINGHITLFVDSYSIPSMFVAVLVHRVTVLERVRLLLHQRSFVLLVLT